MKSTLFNMVAVLFVITLLASGGVGAVYMITKEPIAVAQQNATREALKLVLPPFDTTVDEEIEKDELMVHTAMAADQVVGYAVESMTKNGFSGVVRLMVGFTPDGEVINIQVLEQSETPGLGTKMADEGNPLLLSFQGKYPAQMNMSVKKDGGDVDALTAATISSRAYVDAVRRAYNAYVQKVGGEPVNASSGASQQTDGASGATSTEAYGSASGMSNSADATQSQTSMEEKGGQNE